MTDASYLLQVAPRVCPYYFHSNILTTMLPFPHVGIPTPKQRVFIVVIANGDLQVFREKFVEAARPVQSSETFHPGGQ